jgi:diguanylate cyclase (GGDEF)-like protein
MAFSTTMHSTYSQGNKAVPMMSSQSPAPPPTSASRFSQAMYHMREALAWAQRYDDWLEENSTAHPPHTSAQRYPISEQSVEQAYQRLIHEPWFLLFQQHLMAYQQTLHQPLGISFRFQHLLNALVETFGAEAIILTPVLSTTVQPEAWLFRRDAGVITRLKNYTTDAHLHLALGEGRRYLLSLSLKEAGQVMLQWSFPTTHKGVSTVQEAAIKTYWLPLLYAAMMDERLRLQVDKHQALYQVARIANTTTDCQELLDQYLRFMAPLLGASHVATFLPAAESFFHKSGADPAALQWHWVSFDFHQGEYVAPPRFSEIAPELLPEEISLHLSQHVFFHAGVRQYTEDSHLHHMLKQHLPATLCNTLETSRRYYSLVPFNASSRSLEHSSLPPPYGIMMVHEQPWDAFQHEILLEANQWIWQSYQRTQEHERAMYLAHYDELTGLMNRRALQERFIMEAERAVRNRRPLSLAVLDIDFFKQFNDQYGHLVGDDVLRLLSRYLNAHIRRADVLCRYGGEEFVLLLPETHGKEAWELVDRLRENVALHLKVPTHQPEEIWKPVTFSAGIQEVDLSQAEGAVLSTLNVNEWHVIFNEVLKDADAALYLAKQDGRNRVERAN